MAQTLNFNGITAGSVTFNGVIVSNVYFNGSLVFVGTPQYYLDLDGTQSDKVTLSDFLTTEIVGKNEYEYSLYLEKEFDMSVSTGTSFVFCNNFFVSDTFGLLRNSRKIGVHHNSSLNSYRILQSYNYGLKKITVKYSFGTLELYLNDILRQSVTGLSNIPTKGAGAVTLGFQSGGLTLNNSYSKIEINDKIISLNEGSGVNIASNDNSITGVITTANVDPNYINNFVWQLQDNTELGDRELHNIIGQSNTDGRGTVADLPVNLQGVIPNSMVWWDGSWQPLEAGVNGSTTNQVGYIFNYAYQLYLDNPSTVKYFVITALGGTDLDYWSFGGGGYFNNTKNLSESSNDGYNYIMKSTLWLQGESDCVNTTLANEYESKELKMISDYKTEINGNSKFISCNLGNISASGYTELSTVRQAKLNNSTSFDGYIDAFNDVLGVDNLHFTTQGQIDIGLKFFNKYKSL